MFGFLKKLFGTAQGRLLNKYAKIVSEVNRWEEKFQSLSEEELRNKTVEFRERLDKGEPLDHLLPEAYAVVKNVCRRLRGTDVQVIACGDSGEGVSSAGQPRNAAAPADDAVIGRIVE